MGQFRRKKSTFQGWAAAAGTALFLSPSLVCVLPLNPLLLSQGITVAPEEWDSPDVGFPFSLPHQMLSPHPSLSLLGYRDLNHRPIDLTFILLISTCLATLCLL